LGIEQNVIYLGHLSKDNNIKELAHMTAESILKEKELDVGGAFSVYDY